MKRTREAGYNQRLFDGGFRVWLHLARFEWLRDALRRADIPCLSRLWMFRVIPSGHCQKVPALAWAFWQKRARRRTTSRWTRRTSPTPPSGNMFEVTRSGR
jgi:hypothetical protein